MCSAVPHGLVRWPAINVIHAAGSPLENVLDECERVARSEATALLTGETGTGKEVLARMIHAVSPRARGPFVPVNCAAIPEALLESEFFGYEKGAFTGAATARRGRVAAAEGGTLFLDEIGELPISMQVKLLRLLQERRFEPVGSVESRVADFRLIAATNRDLGAEVEAGRFRRDLYFRLFVCPIESPPLRARPDDIPVLFAHFWQRHGETRPVDAEVMTVLRQHPWPGNVRELENLVERIAVCSRGQRITVADLPCSFVRPASNKTSPSLAPVVMRPAPPLAVTEETGDSPVDEAIRLLMGPLLAAVERLPLPVRLPELMATIENRFIERALANTDGNKKAAAAMLGLQRTTLVEKLRRRQRTATGEAVEPAPELRQ